MGNPPTGTGAVSTPVSADLIARLLAAKQVTVFTGAGISAESGVPTFRGNEGLWKKFKPEELANLAAFMKNPDMVWEWYQARRTIIGTVQPNAGHHALVEMETLFPACTVITQNVDNLHRRAGSRNVLELHGNIERNYCMKCGTPYNGADLPQTARVPLCSKAGCAGLIRPDVVWFGEMLPEDEWEGAVRASASADVFFSIGTSAVVYPAASLPLTAKQQGAFLVEINPEETPLTPSADLFLKGLSGVILPAIVAGIQERRTSTQ
jgi:NAD-dependent deacetylase